MDWTDEQVEALRRAFHTAEIDLDNSVEAIKKLCEAVVICWMKLEEAMERVAIMARMNAAQAEREMEELAKLEEKMERLDIQAKRERRCVAEWANRGLAADWKGDGPA